MQKLIFDPDDVLFFRDGRPMEGSRSGSGDHLPNPHVLHVALHAAAHRAFGTTNARGGPNGHQYGSLRSAGPFPVEESSGEWIFPRPADSTGPTARADCFPASADYSSSLREAAPLDPVLPTTPPSKEKPKAWMKKSALEAYLQGEEGKEGLLSTDELFTSDHTVGIAMDPARGTTEKGKFYSAARLRLRQGIHFGAVAECPEKIDGACKDRLEEVFPENGRIRIGGEARTCKVRTSSVSLPLLPKGVPPEGTRLKWVLLTPAIYPDTSPKSGRNGNAHPGGWLPGWIDPETLQVQLRNGDLERRNGESRTAWRARIREMEPVKARLVAVAMDRPQPVTGWKLSSEADSHRGARSTLLAVPAGSVFYFETASPEEARKLADLLNWHGTGDGSTILNRRSSLMGEKGFGLGVCGPWSPHPSFSENQSTNQ